MPFNDVLNPGSTRPRGNQGEENECMSIEYSIGTKGKLDSRSQYQGSRDGMDKQVEMRSSRIIFSVVSS